MCEAINTSACQCPRRRNALTRVSSILAGRHLAPREPRRGFGGGGISALYLRISFEAAWAASRSHTSDESINPTSRSACKVQGRSFQRQCSPRAGCPAVRPNHRFLRQSIDAGKRLRNQPSHLSVLNVGCPHSNSPRRWLTAPWIARHQLQRHETGAWCVVLQSTWVQLGDKPPRIARRLGHPPSATLPECRVFVLVLNDKPTSVRRADGPQMIEKMRQARIDTEVMNGPLAEAEATVASARLRLSFGSGTDFPTILNDTTNHFFQVVGVVPLTFASRSPGAERAKPRRPSSIFSRRGRASLRYQRSNRSVYRWSYLFSESDQACCLSYNCCSNSARAFT